MSFEFPHMKGIFGSFHIFFKANLTLYFQNCKFQL